MWHKDEWIEHADPPGEGVDFSRSVFEQMWEFFQKSPIPHTTGANNENCEYTDDAWFGKNCYLTHSFSGAEDLSYCYRMLKSRDSQYCVFCDAVELCYDLVNSANCYNVVYGLNCRQVRDSAFLYDCRNCSDCMFCFNLRNKQYYFGNQQLTKEEYLKKKDEWDLSSRKVYKKAKQFFAEMMSYKAWHRALSNDNCENTTGNYNSNCKDAENCYFSQGNEQCANTFRNYIGKTSLDFHGQTSELCFYTILAQDECYDVKFSSQIVKSKFMEYSAFCLNCQNCFGCCGLVGKSYYIFNKPYSEEEYHKLKAKIVEYMRSTGEYGKFFPGYFAQNPYDESWASFYFPLNSEEQEAAGFKYRPLVERRKEGDLDASQVPDKTENFTGDVLSKVFWDADYEKPFRIREEDVRFANRMRVPLPYTYYMARIQENFKMIPFVGELREVVCVDCGKKIETSWPAEYDGRILCEEDYLKVVR